MKLRTILRGFRIRCQNAKDCCDEELFKGLEIQALIAIDSAYKKWMMEIIGEDEPHIAILSDKDLIFTGKLIEGRTLEDWIKYGYDTAKQEIRERIMEEGRERSNNVKRDKV